MQSVELVGRLIVSLLAVLAVVWLIGRKLRKGGKLKDNRLIDVLGRQPLGRNSSVAVVRVGEQALIVGVTDSAVNVLGETDLATAQAMVASSTPARRGAAPMSVGQSAAMPAPAPAYPAYPAYQGSRRAAPAPMTVPAGPGPQETAAAFDPAARRSPLAGSALSPQTWRQTVESLRELTTR